MANHAQPTYAILTLALLVPVALAQLVQIVTEQVFVIAPRLNIGLVQHALLGALGEVAVLLEETVNASKVNK